jgi:hypothetical protein
MLIPKWAKRTIWIGGFVSLMVLIVVLGAYWIVKSGGYIRRNPKKVIARMERIFEIDFPDDIKDLRASTSWMEWDNWTTYIIKFRVEPKALDAFIKIEHLSNYEPNDDERAEDILPPPKWYSEPIQKGRMGTLTLDCPRDNATYEAEIYVDTSDEKNFVVYIQGSYHRNLNKLAR